MLKHRKQHRAWSAAILAAIAATGTFILSASASNERQRFAMDNMMPSTPPATNTPTQSGGMTMDGMTDDNMRGSPSQGSMGQNAPRAGGMMDDKMKDMMREHMRAMSGMGASAMGQDQAGPTGMPGMASGSSRLDLMNRIEGRIAFLKAELQISEVQTPTWNKFADALRSSRSHLLQARVHLKGSDGGGADRLERYERHLSERLDALRSARVAFVQLYSTLNETQKHTADELVVPFIEAF